MVSGVGVNSLASETKGETASGGGCWAAGRKGGGGAVAGLHRPRSKQINELLCDIAPTKSRGGGAPAAVSTSYDNQRGQLTHTQITAGAA